MGVNEWTIRQRKETVEIAVGSRFLLNSIGMIRRRQSISASNRCQRRRRRRVVPTWQVQPVPVYAVTDTRLLPAKTPRFMQFLDEHLRNHAHWVEGLAATQARETPACEPIATAIQRNNQEVSRGGSPPARVLPLKTDRMLDQCLLQTLNRKSGKKSPARLG